MGKEILKDVAEQHKFYLANGKELKNIKQLHSELKSMDEDTFNYHVNESKNDFYNWVKDVYQDKLLADDILECSTKEAIMYCLGNHLERAKLVQSFEEMPLGYSTERTILDDLPKGYDKQRIIRTAFAKTNEVESPVKAVAKKDTKLKHNKALKKPLVTLINLERIKKNSKKVKKVNTKKKVERNVEEQPSYSAQDFKKISPMDQDSIIKNIKGVYGFE